MPAAGIAVVPRVVAGQAEENVRVRFELDGAARGPDILVVIVLPGSEIGTEAVMAEPGDRRTDT